MTRDALDPKLPRTNCYQCQHFRSGSFSLLLRYVIEENKRPTGIRKNLTLSQAKLFCFDEHNQLGEGTYIFWLAVIRNKLYVNSDTGKVIIPEECPNFSPIEENISEPVTHLSTPAYTYEQRS